MKKERVGGYRYRFVRNLDYGKYKVGVGERQLKGEKERKSVCVCV